MKESCNLNRWEYFGLYLWGRIFPRYGFGHKKQRIVRSFILGYFQQKVMTILYENSIKLFLGIFWILFAYSRANKNFSIKSISAIFLFLEFYIAAQNFRKKLIKRFWGKLVTDVDVQMDGCMDKDEFIGSPLTWFQKHFMISSILLVKFHIPLTSFLSLHSLGL